MRSRLQDLAPQVIYTAPKLRGPGVPDIYHSRQWRQVRLLALARDGHRCVECRGTARLAVDHITPVDRGGAPFDLANLQTLCRLCHNVKSAIDRRNGAHSSTMGVKPQRGGDGAGYVNPECRERWRSATDNIHDPPRCGCSGGSRPW